jgi:hypothetical protein
MAKLTAPAPGLSRGAKVTNCLGLEGEVWGLEV